MQTLAPWDDLYPFIDILYIYTHFFFLFLHPFIYIYIILLFQIKSSSFLDNQSSTLKKKGFSTVKCHLTHTFNVIMATQMQPK